MIIICLENRAKSCTKTQERKRWTNFKFDFGKKKKVLLFSFNSGYVKIMNKKKWCEGKFKIKKEYFFLIKSKKELKKRQWMKLKKKKRRRREEEGGNLGVIVLKIPWEYILENDTRIRWGYFLNFLSLFYCQIVENTKQKKEDVK